MTKTKQQIQDEIAELQKQLEEMERPKEYWYLLQDNYLAETHINKLFAVEQFPSTFSSADKPHGLGKFETREEAEVARAILIGVLDSAKNQDTLKMKDCIILDHFKNRGQRVIKAIEDGTYE